MTRYDRGCCTPKRRANLSTRLRLPCSRRPPGGAAVPHLELEATPRRAQLPFHRLEQQPICCFGIARWQTLLTKDREQRISPHKSRRPCRSRSYVDLCRGQSSRHTTPLTPRENKLRLRLRGRTASTNPPAGRAMPECNKATRSMPMSPLDPIPRICPRNNLPTLHRGLVRRRC